MSLDPRLTGATIHTCPHCHIHAEPGGRFSWQCDAYHPELIAWLDQQEEMDDLREEAGVFERSSVNAAYPITMRKL